MKDKNLKYIAHAIIVVAFMGLIAFVIYYTGKTAFSLAVIIRFSCINLGRRCARDGKKTTKNK